MNPTSRKPYEPLPPEDFGPVDHTDDPFDPVDPEPRPDYGPQAAETLGRALGLEWRERRWARRGLGER